MSIKIIFKEYILPCIIGITLGLIINQFIGFTKVSGLSMYSTLNDNDRLIINKIETKIGKIEKGDIITFNSTPNETKHRNKVFFIKRIIGEPGDKILIENGIVYVNDKIIEEAYIDDEITEGYINITVPQDEFFVMGDNRDGSTDSRVFGTIKKKDIEGIAIARLFPFNKITIL